MSKIRLYGETSGYVELQAPAIAADNTVNIGDIPQFAGTPSDGDLMVYDAAHNEWKLVSELEAGQVPNLDAAKITTGTLNTARLPAGYLYAGQVRFTSDGTFSKTNPLGTGDIGLRAIKVQVQGAGGGGGGCSGASGSVSGASGAGGGGYAESFITDIAGLASSVAVTVGLGGAGSSGQASNGGNSSFGSLVIGNGGGRGRGGGTQTFPFIDGGGTGGSGTGDLVVDGGNGSPIGYSGGAMETPPGPGGGSFLGTGGRRAAVQQGASTGNPQAAGGGGRGYGSGPGGPFKSTGSANTVTGTAGQPGIVIIDCYV